jgi:hypothetical protein
MRRLTIALALWLLFGKKFEEQKNDFEEEVKKILQSKKALDDSTVEGLMKNLRQERSEIEKKFETEKKELDREKKQAEAQKKKVEEEANQKVEQERILFMMYEIVL